MSIRLAIIFLTLFFHVENALLLAQSSDFSIEYSGKKIKQNEVFEITITSKDSKIKNVSSFPNIVDWAKQTTSIKKEKKQWKIFQSYQALKTGIFEIDDFTLTINQKSEKFKGTVVEVIKNSGSQYLGLDSAYSEKDFKLPLIDCKLAWDIEKSKLYQSEFVRLKLLLLINQKNEAELNFFNLKEQLKLISNNCKIKNLWINEVSDLRELKKEAQYPDKSISQAYILFDAYISPQDTGQFTIDVQNFSLLSYKIFKNENSIFRKYLKHTLTSPKLNFKSIPLPIKTEKDLPVGEFEMKHSKMPNKIWIGKAYNFNITLISNTSIAHMSAPSIIENKKMDIFVIKKEETLKNEFASKKSFTFYYQFIPRDTGNVLLSELIKWQYFDTKSQFINILKPELNIEILRKSKDLKNENNQLEIDEYWQTLFDKSSNRLLNLEQNVVLKYISNGLIILMLLTTIYLILRE